MKVYGNKPPENQEVYLKAQKADRPDMAAEKGAIEKNGGNDKITLSGRAKEIAELKNAINQLPEIRTDKVQAVEKAIAEGTYKIDSQKIAGKLVDEMV